MIKLAIFSLFPDENLKLDVGTHSMRLIETCSTSTGTHKLCFCGPVEK